MDLLKKKRSVQRTAFSKALRTFEEHSRADPVDIDAVSISFEAMEVKMQDLKKTSDALIEELFNSDASEAAVMKEYDETDDYGIKFLSAKRKFEKITRAPAANVDVSNRAESVSTSGGSSETRKKYELPKIELVKFSGNIKEWLTFWSFFKKIHEDPDLDKESKFQYLIQAMVPNSRASDLVRSYPPTNENYDKAINGFKDRFGRRDLQIEVYVRELLKLVIQNSMGTERLPLSTLYDKIEAQLRAIESLGVATEDNAAMLVPLVESCLPEELMRAWQRSNDIQELVNDNSSEGSRKTGLNSLIHFLNNEVRVLM